MKELIEEVLTLQPLWSATTTPEMTRRGLIVRNEMPAQLRVWAESFTQTQGGELLSVEGKDHQGNRTEIPWVRVFSKIMSPDPQTGWYVVYLFSGLGGACYLALGQGSTSGADQRSRPIDELNARNEWARAECADQIAARGDLHEKIDLEPRRTSLAKSYEAGTAVAIRYEAGSVPDDAQLQADLDFMLEMLSRVYAGEASRGPQNAGASAVSALATGLSMYLIDADEQMTQDEIAAFDEFIITEATSYLESLGNEVRLAGGTDPYDLVAEIDGVETYVLVRGSRGAAASIELSVEELSFHRHAYPRSALFVVGELQMTSTGGTASVNGGNPSFLEPWALGPSDVRPVRYSYSVPSAPPAS